MSKNRDLIYDMAEAPETEDFEQPTASRCSSAASARMRPPQTTVR